MSRHFFSIRRIVAGLVVTAGILASLREAGAANGFDANGQCVGDANGDGVVSVDELLTAVNNAANSCQFEPVTLQFRANVGDQPFTCGNTYHAVGTTRVDIVPSDFRFYIHDIRLETADGHAVPVHLIQDGKWQYQNLALLDFENKAGPCREEGNTATNTTVRGTVAPGTYTGVRFTLGVPFALDHIDQGAPSTPSLLSLSSLFWGWQDGYRFLKIDLVNVGILSSLFVHVGSMGCHSGPGSVVSDCTNSNLGAVRLDNFNPASSVIVADLAALLSDSDLNTNQADTPPGCESNLDDLDCVPIFKNLGINFADGSPNPTTQKFFRVE